ncbi:NACHT, LRR and PYD domains-containing protein 3-like [Megalops cyprinoides]|uniref:NACHT, LRR and PYD domains-containing protein 3-like n=1 Tax=Megalops cyprinoides TaxID=118141 RepID=UPI001864E422|nr:NACHT, LRR and PYD domains-containing protein 3-like [Megalops cyprinoides]
MAESSIKEDRVEQPPADLRSATLHPSITAQSGGNAVVPQFVRSNITGDLNITININSEDKGVEDGEETSAILDARPLQMKEQTDGSVKRAQQTLKSNLKKKFECIFEGLAKLGHRTLLNEIYTELYITEGVRGEVNKEHEVRQIETVSMRQTRQETPVICNDIFKPLPGQTQSIRTVLTKGIAGIGKTVSVQKFILDWAEGKANQDVRFVFVLPFRELNFIKDDQHSLLGLLNVFHHEMSETEDNESNFDKVLFIFDGLDESRLTLNFQCNKILTDVKKTSSVDMLLTNLIKGNLLPSALLWITSRPAAANQIPPEYIHRVTEVRGFSDPQKEEYFRKRFNDQNLASRIISHIKSSRSLYIMCHIPVFCWISATVLKAMLVGANCGEIPKSLTEMYTHFLLIQTNLNNQKYRGSTEKNPKKMSASDAEIILKLGQLAFLHLEKGNLTFYEEDLSKCGIDVTEASVYSGVCTEIFKEECGLYQEKVYCFVHLSIQEYLAALFVFHSYVYHHRNVFQPDLLRPHGDRMQLFELHKITVDQALQSENGHLDLFLRFLLGLSMEFNQRLLGGFLTQTGNSSNVADPLTQYIKEMIKSESSAEKTISLLHCLNELNDNSLMVEIQTSLASGTLSEKELELEQCSALAFVLLMSEDVLDVFDLKKYKTSWEGRQRLAPVVKNCRSAILDSCNLTEESCVTVASALQLSYTPVRELDLSYNKLEDSGVKWLCAGLMSPNCKLQTLKISGCGVSEEHCASLASVLCSNTSLLRELDLGNNILGDTGVKLLCTGLMSPNCNLQRLGLSACEVTGKGTASLASALCSNSSQLRELDLSYNHLRDIGVRALSTGLEDLSCKLETLLLGWCNLTEGCCDDLASVLRSHHSELRELELRDNDLQDSGVRALSAGLEDPHCKLQRLGLSGCQVTDRGCVSLVSALRSNPSHLRELDLSYNHPGDSGVRALVARLEDPIYKLGTFLVDHGGISRIKPGLRKYACQLTLDPNTAHRELSLSEKERKVTKIVERKQPCPDHPEKFDTWSQVLCREGLSGARYYWEAEWSGTKTEWRGVGAGIGVTYKGISRKGGGSDSYLGGNDKSWSLYCTEDGYSALHNGSSSDIPAPPSCSNRVGVYLDWPAGTLSFYSVSSDTLTLLHTFHTTFTEPLYPGFWLYGRSSVSLCMLG